MSAENVTTLHPDGTAAELTLAAYAESVGASFRSAQRWIAAGELPDAWQDDKGRWWVPANARRQRSSITGSRGRRTTSHDVVPDPSTAVERPAVPASSPLGMLGTLDEAARALGTTTGGVRRLAADGHLHIGRYGPNGALRVFVPPRS